MLCLLVRMLGIEPELLFSNTITSLPMEVVLAGFFAK